MDVVEQIEGVLNRATQDFDGRDDIMQRAADEIKRLRALAERAGGVKGEWHRADGDKSILLYTLRQDGWRKGEAVMVNDVTVRIEAANGSESPIEPIASAILSALEPAAAESEQEAARIGDAVLAWMTKYDLLEGEQEYYVADVIAVLDDLTPLARPSEQAVTEAMLRSAIIAYRDTPEYDHHIALRNALKAAMEAGRHD